MPSGVGGGILSNPPVKPAQGALWVCVNGVWRSDQVSIPVGSVPDVVALLGATQTFLAPNTFANGVAVSGGTFLAGSLYYGPVTGTTLAAKTGSVYDLYIATPAAGGIFACNTGSADVSFLSATDSTSAATGGAIYNGGLGVAKNIVCAASINCAVSLKVASVQVVGAQIAGFGTPTNAALIASMNGSTAYTNAQLSGMLAYVVQKLALHGLFGV